MSGCAHRRGHRKSSETWREPRGWTRRDHRRSGAAAMLQPRGPTRPRPPTRHSASPSNEARAARHNARDGLAPPPGPAALAAAPATPLIRRRCPALPVRGSVGGGRRAPVLNELQVDDARLSHGNRPRSHTPSFEQGRAEQGRGGEGRGGLVKAAESRTILLPVMLPTPPSPSSSADYLICSRHGLGGAGAPCRLQSGGTRQRWRSSTCCHTTGVSRRRALRPREVRRRRASAACGASSRQGSRCGACLG